MITGQTVVITIRIRQLITETAQSIPFWDCLPLQVPISMQTRTHYMRHMNAVMSPGIAGMACFLYRQCVSLSGHGVPSVVHKQQTSFQWLSSVGTATTKHTHLKNKTTFPTEISRHFENEVRSLVGCDAIRQP